VVEQITPKKLFKKFKKIKIYKPNKRFEVQKKGLPTKCEEKKMRRNER